MEITNDYLPSQPAPKKQPIPLKKKKKKYKQTKNPQISKKKFWC